MSIKRVCKARKRQYPCPDCGGTGHRKTAIQLMVPEVTVICEKCHGTGKVTTKPLDDIDVLYDSMKVKDMTRHEFRLAYKHMMNPKRSVRDLERMRMSLEVERQMRAQVGRRIRRG